MARSTGTLEGTSDPLTGLRKAFTLNTDEAQARADFEVAINAYMDEAVSNTKTPVPTQIDLATAGITAALAGWNDDIGTPETPAPQGATKIATAISGMWTTLTPTPFAVLTWVFTSPEVLTSAVPPTGLATLAADLQDVFDSNTAAGQDDPPITFEQAVANIAAVIHSATTGSGVGPPSTVGTTPPSTVVTYLIE